jgi:predicted Zn-dependent protease
MNNRLYCTFTTLDAYEEIANAIKSSYVILFNKIFVLKSLNEEKIMLTYNVDMNNSAADSIIDNTILVHRKKQTNTLYTINALNELIKSLNNGVLDKSFVVNWNDYRNCILLIQTEGFNRIDTKIKEIINL